MAPKGWTNDAELEFLTSLMPEYEICREKRRYKLFWQRLNSEFLAKFPVMDKIFPGMKVTDLTPEQRQIHTAAVVKQQQACSIVYKRLKEWFRWQFNPRSRHGGVPVLSKKELDSIYNGRTRALKPYEVFARLNSEQVSEAKAKRCEAQGLAGRQTLKVWHEVSKELYESASPEQLDAVQNALSMKRGMEVDPADNSATYLRFSRALPTLLDAIITPAVRQAGVMAFVTIAGPDPEQGGKITCKSLQFGDKPETPSFSEVWKSHSVYCEELAQFARRYVFPPEVSATRCLNHVIAGSSYAGKAEAIEFASLSKLGCVTQSDIGRTELRDM